MTENGALGTFRFGQGRRLEGARRPATTCSGAAPTYTLVAGAAPTGAHGRRSTPTTGRTAGSSRSRRRAAITCDRSTGRPATPAAGRTSAAMVVTPGVDTGPATSCGSRPTGVHQSLARGRPDDAAARVARPSAAPAATPEGRTTRSRPPSRPRSRSGPGRDPAARRQPDASDTGRHDRHRPRLLRRCSPTSWACWPAAATPRSNRFVTAGASVPADLTAAWGRGDFLSAETATLVTSQFLHGGWLHLAGQPALPVDLRQQRRGSPRAAAFLALLPRGGRRRGPRPGGGRADLPVPTIGASGAIAATLGAYFVFFPRARITSLVFLGFFYQLIDVPAVIVLGLLVRPPAHRRARRRSG